jgi:hypothetical protein
MTRPFNPSFRIRSDYAAAIAVTLAPLIYFLPALRSGDVLCPDDGILFNTPLRVAAASIMRAGHLPLWDPYIFSGMPLLGAAQGGLLFPLNWFYLLFSPATATNVMVVSSYMIAAIGAYLYSRRAGASISGAMITSLVWQLSGALIGQISHINIVHTAAMLPWVLWSLEHYADTGSFKRGALLAAIVAIQVFAGHQQTFAYAAMLVAAYAITIAIADASVRKRYLSSLAFIATGVFLAAVQIVPTFELLRNSSRGSATYEFFTSFSMPRRFVLALVAPYVLGGGDGRLFRAPYVGPPFYPELVGYVGVLAIMLAVVAVLLKPDVRTKFWAIAAAVCLLLAFGGYAPLHFYKLIYYVPGLNLFRVPARHLMEVDFALAVLAGRGLTGLAARRGNRQALTRVAFASALVWLFAALAVTVLRPAEFHLARETAVSVLRAPELFIPILIAGMGAAALWLFARQRRGATPFLFAVLVFDLVLWGQSSGWYTASPKSNEEYWRVPETVKALRSVAPQDAKSYRILTAPHTFDSSGPPVGPSASRLTDWVLWTQPDVYMMHGIQNAAGYDGFGLDRYSKLVGQMKVWGEVTDPDTTFRGDSREIDLVNARYLLATRKQSNGVELGLSADAFLPATEKFGDFMFASTDLGLPIITKDKRLTFSVAPVEIDHVAMLTNLAWSENVPDNTIVARLRLSTTDGRKFEFPLRAGADTAEWAYDRPDIRARIRHRRPTVATSYGVSDAKGNYEAHTYVSSVALPEKMKIARDEIVIEPDPHWPDLTLSVFRLSLISASEGKTYAPRRNSISVGSVKATAKAETAIAAPNNRWKLAAQTQYVDIYENVRAMPRAWMASEARVLDEATMLEVIRSGKFADGLEWDPARTALIESELSEQVGAGPAGRAEIKLYEPNRIDVNTRADTPSVLVLSENHYPGWRTYVDGRAVETLRVDYNLRGVPLPAGEHKVEFIYRPKSALVGIVISMVALVMLIAGIVVERKYKGLTK